MENSHQHDCGDNAVLLDPALACTTFVDDRWIAQQIGMKPATIRSQRFKRSHGLPHWLDIDHVMIGSKPRYSLAVAFAYLRRLASANEAGK